MNNCYCLKKRSYNRKLLKRIKNIRLNKVKKKEKNNYGVLFAGIVVGNIEIWSQSESQV